MRIKISVFGISGLSTLLLLLAACGPSDQEQAVINICHESSGGIDAYNEEGIHYSETAIGRRVIKDVCAAKAELYVKGYRISQEFHVHDIEIYRLSIVSDKSLISIYKKAIREGAPL